MYRLNSMKKFVRPAFVVLAVVGLAAIAHASGGAEGAHGGGPSSEKWWDLFWRTLNFIALVIILGKFLAKPIANGLKSRQQAIGAQFDDLESRKAEADRRYKEFEDKLARIDEEIKEIIDNARAMGESEKQRIIEEAQRNAGDIRRQAEMAVQHELAAAKLKLREEAANQAMVIAEEIIRKNLQEADQVKLIEDYLEKVSSIQKVGTVQ